MKTKLTEIIWRASLTFFCLSIFTSKAGVGLFGVMLILASLPLISWTEFKKQTHLVVFVGLYPLGILLNLFSLGGLEAALKTAYSWPWPLLALPSYVLLKRPQDWMLAAVTSCLSLAIGCLVSIYQFATDFGFNFTNKTRVSAFWDISRWGVFLTIASLTLFGAINSTIKLKGPQRIILNSLLLISIAGLILSGSRGPWLACALGLTIYTVLNLKALKGYLALVGLLVLTVAVTPSLRERVMSIGAVKTDQSGKITSDNGSNAARLHMWKVALDFFQLQPLFGTGFEMAEAPMHEFIAAQTEEYRQKYTIGDFSYRDQHSSYFWVLVQMGVVFFIVLWGYFVWVAYTLLKAYVRSRSPLIALQLSVFSAFAVMFVFYSSINSYEMILLVPWLTLIPSGSKD